MIDQAKNPRSIFLEIVEKVPHEKWAESLDQACGDNQQLRTEVQRLLKAHEEIGTFMDRPAADPFTIDSPIAEGPGTEIGAYQLLQQIGEGGMGVVFMAEQREPIQRTVALKIIKPGMDTRQVIARFEAERQALALMDHPNIAKVHDAGTTAPAGSGYPGRPYFVMELVKGVPITKYCDEKKLSLVERLELFVPVCQAVQHAHQKGVIHRDIKPTNVLVAEYDNRAVPKVIDFGVAKATAQRLTERTIFTEFGQMVGTVEYMSPEQAKLNQLDIDTRSDIYSLGVLLYELLTGSTPFEQKRLREAAFDEVLRIIREEEPPRPSTKLSSSDALPSIAANRHTEPDRLNKDVRGELEWIAMKCLEKDRNRRYETANGLARDIERYLHDEPVQACPPSAAYRFRKFARRNKTLLAAGGAISAALILGLGLSTWQYFRAATEKARAQAVSGLMQEMLTSADRTQARGEQYTVRELLDDFSAGPGNQLADQPAAAADIHATIGGAYSMLGLQAKAEPQLAKAVELRKQVDGPEHENVAKALVDYAWTLRDQTRYVEAEDHLREALEIYRRRGVTGDPVTNALSALQSVLINMGRRDEAKRAMDEARAIADSSGEGYYNVGSMLQRYAYAQMRQGDFAEAEQLARQSIEIQRSLPGKQPLAGAYGLLTLSQALQSQQKLVEAEQAARESLEMFRGRYAPDHRMVRSATDQLKSILTSRGDKSALERLAREKADAEIISDSPGYHVRLAKLLLANRSQNSATSDVAHQLIRRAIEEYGQVAVDAPDDLERRLKAADGYVEVTKLCLAHPDFSQEIDLAHQKLSAELQGLLARFPDSAPQEAVAHKYRWWAFTVQQNGGYLAQVERAHREAIKLFTIVSRDNPMRTGIWFVLANSYVHHADALWRLARLDDAAAAFGHAIEIYDEHAEEVSQVRTPVRLSKITWDYSRIAYFLASTTRKKEAAEFVHKAALNVVDLEEPNERADALYYIALSELRLGDKAGYRESCKALVEIPFGKLEGIFKSRPIWTPCIAPDALDDPTLPVKLAEGFLTDKSLGEQLFGLYLQGAANYRSGNYEQAAKRFEESIAAFPSGAKVSTHSINYPRLFLAMTKWQLGQKDDARKLLAEIVPAVETELQPPSSSWNRWATLELLRAEAEALIGRKEADEAAENKNRTSDDVEQDTSTPVTTDNEQLKTDD